MAERSAAAEADMKEGWVKTQEIDLKYYDKNANNRMLLPVIKELKEILSIAPSNQSYSRDTREVLEAALVKAVKKLKI